MGQVTWAIVLVLAVDTSTPAVTSGLVQLHPDGELTALATRVTVNARAHAEVLTPQILECLDESRQTPAGLSAIVVGVGPGPYTGLRVGMATAAAFGDALGIPVYGVCSLDGIAAEVGARENLLVVTDARRREVYWARYVGGLRVQGPGVVKPADLPAAPSTEVAGSAEHVGFFALPALAETSPTPRGLVRAALAEIAGACDPAPLVPLYLRRPDATEPRLQRRASDAEPRLQRKDPGATPSPQAGQ